jgi:predicted ribosome-associated RNA-binding protein Tma20
MYDLIDAMWLWKNRNDGSLLRRMLRPPESLIGLPRAFIKESALESVYSGAQVMAPALEGMEQVERGGRVAMYCGGLFVGVGVAQVSDTDFAAGKKKGIVIKLERVHRP